MTLHVLALNSGSSSLRFGLYDVDAATPALLLDGEAEQVARGAWKIHASDHEGRSVLDEGIDNGRRDALDRIAALLADRRLPAPEAIGHRVVHGGIDLRRHGPIDDAVVAQLKAACVFAPLHLPSAIEGIEFARQRFPGVVQYACLDTAFHASLDDVARVLPLPRSFALEGIRRYGFHGLSCESIVRQLGHALPHRLVIAHLGNGASVSAVRDGRSIDTTMGLTPTGGLVMGTRSGDLDPGLLVYLMRERGYDVDAIEDLVNRRSGLAGVSGLDSDMRALRRAAATNPDAGLAIAMFCHVVRKHVAAMGAALGGIDTLIFTGGIGENDAVARADICGRLAWLGLTLDDARNEEGEGMISADASPIEVRVVPSREDEQIAVIVGTMS